MWASGVLTVFIRSCTKPPRRADKIRGSGTSVLRTGAVCVEIKVSGAPKTYDRF